MDPVISGHRKFRQASGSIIHTSFGPGRIVHIYLYTVDTLYTHLIWSGVHYTMYIHMQDMFTQNTYMQNTCWSRQISSTHLIWSRAHCTYAQEWELFYSGKLNSVDSHMIW